MSANDADQPKGAGSGARHESFCLPPALKDLGQLLEDAGLEVVYGPNPKPVPEGLSAAAKQTWAILPSLATPVADPQQLAAARAYAAGLEEAFFGMFAHRFTIQDATLNGITTMWVTPPAQAHGDKAVLYVHGGGFVLNSRRTELGLQTAVASALGVKVVSVEYPLAPENPYPAALDAVVAAYRGLLDQFGAERLCLIGASAGGGLVLATLLRLGQEGLPLPAASAALSPMADLTLSGDLFTLVGDKDPILSVRGATAVAAAYTGAADPRDPLVSPVFGDYTGVTPLFVFAGTRELLGSDGIRTAARAREAGCEVELVVSDGMWHLAIGDRSGIPEMQAAFDEMIRFFRRHLRL